MLYKCYALYNELDEPNPLYNYLLLFLLLLFLLLFFSELEYYKLL